MRNQRTSLDHSGLLRSARLLRRGLETCYHSNSSERSSGNAGKKCSQGVLITITDADFAYNIAVLVNTSAQAEALLYSLERAAAGIGFHVNAHRTEYMCFNQRGVISTQNGSSVKLVDKFTYLGSSVSSTQTDIDMLYDIGHEFPVRSL